ncbi:sigma-54 interaction domain-containing protein [Geosporobacter ferrireducens]|uniref:Sigma-54 factor interaction domain-containing protein n=1 Tax=Geosporobacter ferrireducens TaxID=1424294 RepID=A0A1D8GDA7_9FIRM|nr:sigma 54-interacting transcriptional regulator [Geosporobacter ferrireducens]AOT68893.1 hypothetical protein Gferi_04570 [Geosporobacter ferrireducens]
MLTTLQSMQQVFQQLAEATSNLLNLDIEVIDTNLTRIAGTGILKDTVGQKVTRKGMIANLINKTKEKRLVVNNPGEEPFCMNCSFYGNCLYKKAVYSSIIFEGEIIGVIGVVTFEGDNNFLQHTTNDLLMFIEEIGKLICAKIAESNVKQHISYYDIIHNSIINELDMGVILLDKEEKIINLNEFIENRLNMNRSIMIGQFIFDVLPRINLETRNNDYQKITIGHSHYLCHIKKVCIGKNVESTIINLLEDHQSSRENYRRVSTKNHAIIGKDRKFTVFMDRVRQVAATESTVLLVGETGTGKELFSEYIYKNSLRRNNNFTVINCSAIPEGLVESELFGYEKGAFTGATSTGKDGKFFAANKGTVFLDEIEAIPLHVQPKLLRVLENRTIEKIGSIKENPIDIRVIAATNVDLKSLVEKGKFREDLFHRLNVITLFIPPLRERKEDILLLSQYFISMYANKLSKKIIDLDNEVKDIFVQYEWKGNVRELKNAIEYAVSIEYTEYITRQSLPYQINLNEEPAKKIKTMADIEKEHIIKVLNHFGWSDEGKILAANSLGISRSTIYRKIKEYKIKPVGYYS